MQKMYEYLNTDVCLVDDPVGNKPENYFYTLKPTY